jgi:hypothetical protein
VVLLMTKRKRFWIVAAAIPLVLLALLFTSATYGDDRHGIHYISRPPVASISWGPKTRYIIQDGINVIRDRAPRAQAGNFIEFPISSQTRLSIRLFSISWLREELTAWKSNHQKRTSCSTPFVLRSAPPNQSMQPTAGRRTASLCFMKRRPLQTTLTLASGG